MSKQRDLLDKLQNNEPPENREQQQATKIELMRPIFNVKRKRTTMEVDIELHRWLKHHALDIDEPMADIYNRVMKEYRNKVERAGRA